MDFGILYEQEGTCARRDAAQGVFEASAGPYAKVARKVEEHGPSISVTFQEPVPFYGWYLKVCLASLYSHADSKEEVMDGARHDAHYLFTRLLVCSHRLFTSRS